MAPPAREPSLIAQAVMDDVIAPPREIQHAASRAAKEVTFAVFVIALFIYLLTIAPDYTWAFNSVDGGELMSAAITLGIPHPPGYPLYVLLGKLVSMIPAGSIAFRFHLLSAFAAAGASAVFALTAASLAAHSFDSPAAPDDLSPVQRVRLSGFFAGSTVAFTPLIWQQAVVAEVYALNLLAVSLVLYSASSGFRGKRAGYLTGLSFGISLITHLTSLFLAPIVLVALKRRQLSGFVAGLVTGLSPTLVLPFLAAGNSPVVWGQADTLGGWWWLVSGKIYHPNAFALPVERWLTRMVTWASEPSIWLAVLFMLVSGARWYGGNRAHRPMSGLLLLSTCGYLFYAFAYDAPDAIVLTLPALALLVVAVTANTQSVSRVLLLLPLALLVLNFLKIDLSTRDEARALAQMPMREAPPDAILLTSGDHTTFSLWYLQHVEGQRKDVIIIDEDLFAFDWYRGRLMRRYPSLAGLDEDNVPMLKERNQRTQPWCAVQINPDRPTTMQCESATP